MYEKRGNFNIIKIFVLQNKTFSISKMVVKTKKNTKNPDSEKKYSETVKCE